LLSEKFGGAEEMEVLFSGSEVRKLLGMGRSPPRTACSLEAHAIPQVAEMSGPSLYTGASLQIWERLLNRTTF